MVKIPSSSLSSLILLQLFMWLGDPIFSTWKNHTIFSTSVFDNFLHLDRTIWKNTKISTTALFWENTVFSTYLSDAFGADAEWVTKWEAKDWVEPDTHKLQSCNILWSIVYVSFWQNSGQAIPTSTMKSVQDSASDWTRFIIDHQKRVHMVHVVKWWIHIKSSLISTKKNIHVKLSENWKMKWSDFQFPFSPMKKPA